VTSPEPKFTVTDRRGVSRASSGLIVGGADTEMRRLRASGVSLPNSPAQARTKAAQITAMVKDQGSLANSTRKIAADMRRSRMASLQRLGSDMQIAMPKLRTPMGTLADQNIPHDIEDEEQLSIARAWARLFYATHDLVPLLVDIYSRFPVTGLEFESDDPEIEDVYSRMFLDDLDYQDFLPNSIMREFFIAGECTTLAYFDERLGTWAREEVLDPDRLRVSKSLFVEQERVQLLTKDLVESLRNPPKGVGTESKSQQMQRMWELKTLQQHHPEIVEAATQDDGLDISEGLWSRLVNRVSPWDKRGVPPLMRSFRTLLMEESLHSAQNAIADRLYSPFILATLGIENMGDGEGWIPTRDDLNDLRDDMQTALMADFKLMVHHMGLKIENVFGREAMPRFDQDYDRVDMKLMQAWGIGQALIMGGTAAAGTYASSALNREVVELNMKDAQRKASKHIYKRMEVVAEAQRHYAYEKKGPLRIPVWREVVRLNEETGEEEVVRCPKLLMPKIRFASLNLRDEQTERQFYADLKAMGAPISDKTMALNLDIDFDRETSRNADETVDKLVAQAEAMAKAKQIIDAKNRELPVEKQLPYPPDMVNYLAQTLILRQQLAAAEMAEGQAEMLEQQADAMSPAGQLGILPGPASAMPMGADPMMGGAEPPAENTPAERPRNWARPQESDEMRAGAPRAARRKGDKIRKETWLERGPSSLGDSLRVGEQDVEHAVRRREVIARHKVANIFELATDPGFYQILNSPHEGQVVPDLEEIRAGGAPESAALLKELAEQYEDVTGVAPTWD